MGERVAELIERMERASGPDRELDQEIHKQFGSFIPFHEIGSRHNDVSGGGPVEDLLMQKAVSTRQHYVARYTSSIDAALSLVPEGFRWRLGYSKHVPCVADLIDYRPNAGGNFCGECDSNHAIALCIAALRARSHSVGE